MAKLVHASRCRILSLISTILAINIFTVTSYSLGECAPCSTLLSCASNTPACNTTSTPCSSKHWANPAARDTDTLYCVANYTATCAESENQFYSPCTIYNIIMEQCNAYERCVLSENGRYAVLQEKGRNGCYFPGRYMLVPTRPCTGVESSDPLCTGPEGELYWQETWQVATKEKSFPSLYDQNATWTMLINPINGRSQQQMHFKIAYFKPDNPIARKLASSSSQTYSTNPSQPTINIFNNNTDVTKDITTSLSSLSTPEYDILSSVFIPAGGGDDISSVVRPFETAVLVDKASVNGTVPYGIMVFPYQQQEGEGEVLVNGSGQSNSSAVVTGFVVSNFYNLDGSDILVRVDGVGNDCKIPPSGIARVGNGVVVVFTLIFALFF